MESLSLILRKHNNESSEDTNAPKFEILLTGITFAYNKEELISYVCKMISARSDPALYPDHKEIKLDSKLEGDEFYMTNKILEHVVKIYNNLDRKVDRQSE